MTSFLRIVASAALSLTLMVGVGISLTGCSADALSGPQFETHAKGGDGGHTGGGGSEHNTDKGGDGGHTGGGGSEHNTD